MTLALLLLTSFFLAALLVRHGTSVRVCAICAAACCTWLVLLVLYWTRGGIDPLAIGIVMGGSAAGAMYYLAAKLPESARILQFPFLVSLFWLIAKALAGPRAHVVRESLIVTLTWIAFGAIFLLYRNNRLRALGTRLLACCKNW